MNIDIAQFEEEVATNDVHRREVAMSSMRGKIASCRIIMETADKMAARALDAANRGDYATAYRNCEGVFAASEEISASLKLVQLLSVKSNNMNNIPELPKFKNAVIDGSLPTS